MKNAQIVNFAAGAVTHTEGPINLQGVGAITLICPAEFNTDTLTLASSQPGDNGFTISAVTGQNRLTSEQQLAISTYKDLRITTSAATSAASTITVMTVGG